jgi:hypothetical protein
MSEITHQIYYHQALALIQQLLKVSLHHAQSLNLSHSLWVNSRGDMCAPCWPMSEVAALIHAEEARSHD